MTIDSTVVVITRPMKVGDPTEHTYQWAEEVIKLVKKYGYTVIDIKKEEATYENLSKTLAYYRPRMYIHVGHGCPTSLQGQKECILTRRFDVNELVSMPNFRDIIQPLIYLTGCTNTCMQQQSEDVCSPVCTFDTNVNLLKGTLVYTIACYSASQLGVCAVKYGADVYVGFKDLMLFPVDEVHSQDIFKNVHLVFIKELLEGHTVEEAEITVEKYEDELITLHKNTKYIALPLLWNKINRRVLGDENTRL